jgi:hypothetical protein
LKIASEVKDGKDTRGDRGRGSGADGYLNFAIIQKRPHYKEGLYHFGMEVNDIEKLRSVCKEFGAASEIQKMRANRDAEYRVADPDGNLIDLSQHGWPV